MVLQAISNIFKEAGLVGSTWSEEMTTRGTLVSHYRAYYEGKHQFKLSTEARKMMQINNDLLDRYNANYCEMVVDTMADRLTLESVKVRAESAQEKADEWSNGLLEFNRIDGLAIAVNEATLRDGECFVMCEYDEDLDQTIMARELTWDGMTGVLPVYDRFGDKLLAAAKVFYEGDMLRVNVYFPDKTLRYSGNEMNRIGEDDTVRSGQVPGVPLVAFKNRGRRSVLTNVIPLQDSLNTTLVNMVMTATLSAFSTIFARGWKPPQSISPGMVYHMMVESADGTGPHVTTDKDEAAAVAALNSSYDMKRIEGGEIAPIIAEAEWIIDQISTISSTPIPSKMGGDSQSGEALKQRDTRLVGKALRAQVQLGNAWEDALKLAHHQQTLFASRKPPMIEGYTARWKSAEVRSEADIRETAKLLHEWGYEKEALRVLSQGSMVNYTEDDIKRLIDEKAAEAARALSAAGAGLPGFDMFEPVA